MNKKLKQDIKMKKAKQNINTLSMNYKREGGRDKNLSKKTKDYPTTQIISWQLIC